MRNGCFLNSMSSWEWWTRALVCAWLPVSTLALGWRGPTLPPGGTNEKLPHVPRRVTKAFLFGKVSLPRMLGYSDDPHLGLYLLCCLPQAAKLLSPQLTINRSWNKRLETVASKSSKGQVEKAERQGTSDQEGEERRGRSQRGKTKPRRKVQIKLHQKTLPLGFSNIFSQSEKRIQKYWSV